MSTANITLHDYETAQRAMAHESATTGVVVHGIITLLVSAGLIIINITLAPEFPWSAFAVGGMLIGLVAHWWLATSSSTTNSPSSSSRPRPAPPRCTRARTQGPIPSAPRWTPPNRPVPPAVHGLQSPLSAVQTLPRGPCQCGQRALRLAVLEVPVE